MHKTDKVDCKEINKLIGKISVIAHDGEDVTVENPSPLTMIGKGRHGAVFAINDDVCIKIYGEEDVCARELYALTLGQNTNLVPKIYCHSSKYIVMEIIKGIDLREYLQSQPLTKALSANLVNLLSTFKEIGYERIDHHKRHIYVQENGDLKVLDVGTTVWRNRVYPFPRKLLNSLGKEYKATFLEHVNELNPPLYQEWQKYMEIEQQAASLHQAHFSGKKVNLEKLKKSSNRLLTKKTELDTKIEDLVRKVHKEEWIKALTAKGVDLQEIKEIVGTIEDKYYLNQGRNNNNRKMIGNGKGRNNNKEKSGYRSIIISGSSKKK